MCKSLNLSFLSLSRQRGIHLMAASWIDSVKDAEHRLSRREP